MICSMLTMKGSCTMCTAACRPSGCLLCLPCLFVSDIMQLVKPNIEVSLQIRNSCSRKEAISSGVFAISNGQHCKCRCNNVFRAETMTKQSLESRHCLYWYSEGHSLRKAIRGEHFITDSSTEGRWRYKLTHPVLHPLPLQEHLSLSITQVTQQLL